jgi:hypothetical protein
MNTLLVVGFVIPVTLLFVFALCKAAARPAPKPTPKPERSTYRGPNDSALDYAEFYYGHVDRKSGRRSYAEGRPTMPSEVEPYSETERRTR